ncbi:hypothetical protein K435DRAFT_963035 [Dendrothele bispora CBS 962.96]|uniref:BTB domain-containing protein n=1 Tax=Dendrothele bispora (strain CBS 962.96) TaxID=1314807 RepID=A0A4S8MJZ4_DENBC|nr:hypothetical protein K435DRAFT_963035 [Dendrothele bispora CBS 962.96]
MNSDDSFIDFTSPPFDNPDADLYVRSTPSRTDFFVFKSILAFSSSDFWKNMFQMSNNDDTTGETKNGYPVIPLEESKEVLELLFRFAYPPSSAPKPSLDTLTLGVQVLEASIKYSMQGAEIVIREELFRKFLESEPLRLFALACHHGLETEMKIAAKQTLRLPVVGHEYVEELEHISAGVYHRLQEYHLMCGKLASDVSKIGGYGNFHWIQRPDYVWFTCTKCYRSNHVSIKGDQQVRYTPWWGDAIRSASVVLKDKPSGATLRDPAFMNEFLEKGAECSFCRGKVAI